MNRTNNLIAKYLQGQTTEEEELQLRSLISEMEEMEDSHYDDIRAMLGYHAVRRSYVRRSRRRMAWLRVAVVAAIFVGVGGCIVFCRTFSYQRSDDCYAHIHGEYITSPSVVQQEMEKEMEMIFAE